MFKLRVWLKNCCTPASVKQSSSSRTVGRLNGKVHGDLWRRGHLAPGGNNLETLRASIVSYWKALSTLNIWYYKIINKQTLEGYRLTYLLGPFLNYITRRASTHQTPLGTVVPVLKILGIILVLSSFCLSFEKIFQYRPGFFYMWRCILAGYDVLQKVRPWNTNPHS